MYFMYFTRFGPTEAGRGRPRRGGHPGDFPGDRPGRVAATGVSVVRQKAPGVLGDRFRAEFAGLDAQRGARGHQGFGVGELVGSLGEDQLPDADGERAEGRAAAAVVHDRVDVRQQFRLRYPRPHRDVVRHGAEFFRADPSGGDHDLPAERGQTLDDRGEYLRRAESGAERQVDQRPRGPFDAWCRLGIGHGAQFDALGRREETLVLQGRRADVEMWPVGRAAGPRWLLEPDSLGDHAAEPVPEPGDPGALRGDRRSRQSPFVHDEVGP